jgi:hypothetical protein
VIIRGTCWRSKFDARKVSTNKARASLSRTSLYEQQQHALRYDPSKLTAPDVDTQKPSMRDPRSIPLLRATTDELFNDKSAFRQPQEPAADSGSMRTRLVWRSRA